jgi:hypothetical protein
VDRASITVESSLSSGAYNLVLQGLVQRSLGLSIVHVPADRTFAWSQLPANDLLATVQQWWAEVEQPETQYVLFHFTDDAHYCALLLDVAVWKAGPHPDPAAATIGQHTEQSAAHVTRRSSRRSAAAAAPLLHIDTLPTACPFAEEAHRVLVALAGALDSLFSTTWCITPQNVARCVRTAKHPPQEDEWSCGYHLLHLWSKLFRRLAETAAAAAAAPAAAGIAAGALTIFDEVDSAGSASLLAPAALVEFVLTEYDRSRAAQLEVSECASIANAWLCDQEVSVNIKIPTHRGAVRVCMFACVVCVSLCVWLVTSALCHSACLCASNYPDNLHQLAHMWVDCVLQQVT